MARQNPSYQVRNENGLMADRYHRLRNALGMLPYPSPKSSTEQYDFHGSTSFGCTTSGMDIPIQLRSPVSTTNPASLALAFEHLKAGQCIASAQSPQKLNTWCRARRFVRQEVIRHFQFFLNSVLTILALPICSLIVNRTPCFPKTRCGHVHRMPDPEER